MPISAKSHFFQQIFIKFAGQYAIGKNGIPLFFFFNSALKRYPAIHFLLVFYINFWQVKAKDV